MAGKLKFEDFLDGVTVTEQEDEMTGLSSIVIIDPKQRGSAGKDLRPTRSWLMTRARRFASLIPRFRLSTLCRLVLWSMTDGADVRWVTLSPVSRRKVRRLAISRVVCRELPTCSRPASRKILAFMAEHTGTVSFGKETKGKVRLVITDETGESHEDADSEMASPQRV